MRPELADVIEYRKSGLSLNHVIGCPLDCGYCVRHLFANFEMKTPRALMSDEQAVALLTWHKYFRFTQAASEAADIRSVWSARIP